MHKTLTYICAKYLEMKILGLIIALAYTTLSSAQSFVKTLEMPNWFGVEDAIKTSTDDVVLTGGLYNGVNDNIFVMKLNYLGDTLWSKTLSSPFYGVGVAVKEAPDGDYIVVGTQDDVNGSNVITIKMDTDGNIVWQKLAGDSDYQYASDVVLIPGDGVYVLGNLTIYPQENTATWIMKYDFAGNMLWDDVYVPGAMGGYPNSIIALPNGDVRICGDFYGSQGQSFIVDYNSTGAVSHEYAGLYSNGDINARGVLASANGGAVLGNSYQISSEITITKTNSTGQMTDVKSFSEAFNDYYPYSIYYGPSSYIVVGESFAGGGQMTEVPVGSQVFSRRVDSRNVGDQDMFIMAIDSSTLDTLWTREYGAPFAYSSGKCFVNFGDTVFLAFGTTDIVSGNDLMIVRDYFGTGTDLCNSTSMSIDNTNTGIITQDTLGASLGTPAYTFQNWTLSSNHLNLPNSPNILCVNGNPCMVADYHFNTNDLDLTGFSNHLINYSAVYTADRAGVSDYARLFDGSTSYMQANEVLNGASEFTISTWIKFNGSYPAADGAIISNWGSASPQSYSLRYESNTITGNVAGLPQVISPLSGSDNTDWIHIALTYDAGSFKIYKNGVLQDDQVSANPPISASTNFFTVGSNTDFDNFFEGAIDELHILQCAYNSTQIDSIYQTERYIVPCNLDLTYSAVDVTCNSGDDATIDLTISGAYGLNPTVIWNNGEFTEDLSNLTAGEYIVTVIDSLGCDTTISVMIAEPAALDFDFSKVDADCGLGNGEATVTINNPVAPPYNYQWSNGATGTTATELGSAFYNVHMTDANNCVTTGSIAIANIGGPAVVGSETNVDCFGDHSGAIDITVSGGMPPYNYAWSNGATTEDVSNLAAASYGVIVQDANGCNGAYSAEITQNAEISISLQSQTLPTCGLNDGDLSVIATGGVPTLNYQWSANAGGQTSATAIALSAGVYSLDVTDNTGCVVSKTYVLNNANGINLSVQSVTPPQCNTTTGGININVSGGQAPYNFSWDSGQATEDISGLTSSGIYTVEVSDVNGCVSSLPVNLPAIKPFNPGLCLISVDTVTNTNLLVWEKPVAANQIDHFNIYRETAVLGTYDLLVSWPYDSISQYVDSTANPQIKAWRYKMSSVDSCGVESNLSPLHKTLHLTVSPLTGGEMQLNWDHYIGFSYPNYEIWRHHPTTGWVNLASPSNMDDEFIDPTPPVPTDLLIYSVEAPHPGCESTRANHNTTRSNRTQPIAFDPDGDNSVVNVDDLSVSIYPNPANNSFTISLSQADNIRLMMYDASGRVVLEKNIINSIEEFSIDHVASGIYTLRLMNDKTSTEVRLIKN